MKNLLLPAIFTGLLALPAHALVDVDTDTLGDIWEGIYGFHIGANPPATEAPAADPDGDGFTNLTESRAGTDPNDATDFPSHASSLTPGVIDEDDSSVLIDPPIFTLTWPTVPGKTYQPLPSEDLVTWEDAAEAFFGEGIPLTFESEALHSDGSVPEKLFWRVAIDDFDEDQDGLSTYEELHIADPNDPTKTLNPFTADTDGDSIPDGLDYANGGAAAAFSNTLASDPDGPGLPASLDNGLIGRWDMEEQTVATSYGDYYTLARYPDALGAHHIVPFHAEIKEDGMPSKCAGTTSGGVGYLCPPRSLLHNRTIYSVSLWVKLEPGSLTAARPEAALFSHHRQVKRPNPSLYRVDLNGMWIERLGNGTEVLRAGTYYYRNHYPNSNTPLPVGEIVDEYEAVSSTAQPAGTFDDGEWHHYLLVRSSGIVTLYRDGELVGTDSNISLADINANNETDTGISLGRFYGPPAEAGVPYTDSNAALASFDRVRMWSRALNAAEAESLYKQDVDQDNLWDITEARTRKWDDHNGNAIVETGEYTFTASPYFHDPEDTDHDDDELTSLDEQNRTLTKVDKPDTDDDKLPDGFEDKYPPLDPLVADDGNADPDDDDLTTAQEYAGGVTNPHIADAELYPPTWISIERTLRYDYDDYGPSQPNAPKELTTASKWLPNTPSKETLTSPISFTQLHTTLTQKQPFPTTFPSSGVGNDLTVKGNATTILAPVCHHAELSHKRIIVKVAAATTEVREYKALLVTKRTIDGSELTPNSEIITLTIPAGQTESAPYDLTPGFTGAATPGNSYSESLLMSASPIQILNAEQIEATELKVAKMEHSLDALGKLDIDADPDRFFFRIKANDSMENVSVKLATVTNPDPAYNDDPTEIELKREGNYFITPSLMLVSDDVDDDYSRNKVGKDDELNDRTHKIQLGGNARVESVIIDGTEHPAGISAPVLVKKKLSGRIIFFGDTNEFDNQQKMVEYRKIAQERYAQVGIELDFNITTIADYPVSVDPENVGVLPGGGPQGMNVINPDIKALYDKVVAEGKNGDITVMVVNVTEEGAGYAVRKSRTSEPDIAYAGCVVLAIDSIKALNKIFTFGHEIGHVLTDDGHYGVHYPTGVTIPAYKVTQNLMRDGTSNKNTIRRSKRYVDLQVGKFRADLLKDP